MNEARTCEQCGAVLDSSAPEGLCPRCVLATVGNIRPDVSASERGLGLAADSDKKPLAVPAVDTLTDLSGTTIGRYKLLQQIGEGGFGIVFMAEQTEPVQRKVALKVIKAGMDTREVIARFEAERQALALMDHPNIAQVLDGGATTSGRPYFVMELVRGLPITEYCDQASLSTRERLELFIKVCHAVQHAHQKGVIHRDLKPGNVLVTLHDGEPVPKVIDFGVAKALGHKLTDKTLFTRFEQMLGTPAYMSPEQAALSGLDVDTRSDIYSLGVLLYELLTGVTPLEAETLRQGALDQIRRMIQETEPPKPSTRLTDLVGADVRMLTASASEKDRASLSRLLQKRKEVISAIRGDLDWITMKALEKDPCRRYETVNGFAADVERHLNLEPVLAGPPTARYRVNKFVSKHRGAVATAAGFVLLLTVATVLSTALAERANRERERAEQNAAKSQQVARFLQDTLKDMGRSVRSGRFVLSSTFDKNVERLGKDLKSQPVLDAELHQTIGDVYLGLGEYAKAERMFREELALQRMLCGEEHANVATALYALAVSLDNQGKYPEAEALLHEALGIRKQLFGNESPYVGIVRIELAEAFEKQHKYAEATAVYHEAMAVARTVSRNELPIWERRLYNLADILYGQRRYAEAEPLYRELLESVRSGRSPEDDEVLGPTASLARLLSDWAWADGTDGGRSPSTATANASVRSYISNSATNVDVLRVGTTSTPYERAREADSLLRECLTIRLGHSSATDWRIDDVRSRLGGAVLAVAATDPAISTEDRQTKLEEAQTLLFDGNQRLQRSQSADRKHKRAALERLVRLYETWEIFAPNTSKSAQVYDWRRKLEAFRANSEDGLREQEAQPIEIEKARK